MSIFDADFPRGHEGASARNAPLGTARWGTTAPAWSNGALFLGRDDQGVSVGYKDDRHAITIAGSRAGKGRSCIIPNLLLWGGSCVVLDPKGENASVTARTRAERPGHKVVVIDPRGCANVPDGLRGTFNPMAMIDHDDDDAIDLAAAIGDALMVGGGDKDVHWTESARQIFEAVLLHVAVTQTGAERGLVRVRQLLILGDRKAATIFNAERVAAGEPADVSPSDALWTVMSESQAANPAVRDVIAGAAHSICEMGDNERGSVLSTARRNTKFIDSPWVRRCLEGEPHPAFDIDELKAAIGGVSLYVCLPARFIPTHARFLRLMLNLILYRMEAQGLNQPACGYPVLFVLDEFAALGRMESIEKAAGLMAGFGVKLWPILQDLGQLKRHYKESWETFMGNAGVLQFFGNADMTTLDWLSKRMGQVEVIRETRGTSDSNTTSLSKSQGQTTTSGWSQSSGTSEGLTEMPDLSRISTRDGGSGLVPFLARSSASGTGQSSGTSSQQGANGGESVQHGDSSSSGTSASATISEAIHQVALMLPDEIARAFERRTKRQIVLIDGAPLALMRANYDEPIFSY